jgi:predicted nuclease with TOPRIM domain
LRESHAHHNEQREALRSEYGPKWEQIERIIRELDHLRSELHMVSDHAVQLDANFEKFGYSAHLRENVRFTQTCRLF